MIKRKRKRNPLKADKKLLRKIAELLAKAIEKEPDGKYGYLLAAELVRRDSLYCEECHNYDIEEGCDWSICYPEMEELLEDSTLDMAKEAAEELAEDLGIVDYVKVFRYIIVHIRTSSISLKNINLSQMDLSEINLKFADLSGTNLSETNLSGAKLRYSVLFNVDLSNADLSGANLSGAGLSGADLSESKLAGADLSGADLSGANLSGANLYKTDFTNAKLYKTIFNNVKNKDSAINLAIPNPKKALYEKTKNKTKKKPRTIRTNI